MDMLFWIGLISIGIAAGTFLFIAGIDYALNAFFGAIDEPQREGMPWA